MHIYKAFFKHWIVQFILIPFLLLELGLALSLFHILTYKTSITVAPVIHLEKFSITPKEGPLYKNGVIRGIFQAQENNLGAVEVRVKNYHSETIVSEDKITFRIKMAHAKDWYYTNSYSGGIFHELDIFPFGFPVIKDSKLKTYEFEITSEKGKSNNYLTLENKMPRLVSDYQFSKSELLTHWNLFGVLISRKFFYALQNPLNNIYYIVIYYLPVIVYALSLSVYKTKFLKLPTLLVKVIKKTGLPDVYIKYVALIDAVILLGIITDILTIREFNNIIFLILIILWCRFSNMYRNFQRSSFIIALVLLIMSPLFFAFNFDIISQKFALWAYCFLVLGTVQLAFSYRRESVVK